MTEQELFSISINPPDKDAYARAKDHFDRLAKPLDGLGIFEEMVCRIAAIRGTDKPDIAKKQLVIMCADNGVVSEGVSQTDSSVTASVVRLMAKRKSTVGVMTEAYPVDITTVDIGIASSDTIDGIVDMKVAQGTGNIATEPAMRAAECLQAISSGIGIVKESQISGVGIIATGEMGIGNTTTAAALFCALSGTDPEKITGRGAGLSDEGLIKKTSVIKTALERYKLNNTYETSSPSGALSALCDLGGLDIAALCGVFIGGALYDIPVVIDGFISAVAAVTAELICPGTKDYMLASHNGRERGCAAALHMLDLKPVIDADMALGEGSGAVMLYPLLDMVMNLYYEGVIFTDTTISQYERFD